MPYIGKGDPKIKQTPYCKEPKASSHKYPIGASVMHHTPPGPGYYTVWYPAKIKTLLKELKAYLLENKEGKVFRRTEQHIRLYNEYYQKDENPSAPPLVRSWSIEPPIRATSQRGYIQPHQHRTLITDDYTQSERRSEEETLHDQNLSTSHSSGQQSINCRPRRRRAQSKMANTKPETHTITRCQTQ